MGKVEGSWEGHLFLLYKIHQWFGVGREGLPGIRGMILDCLLSNEAPVGFVS